MKFFNPLLGVGNSPQRLNCSLEIPDTRSVAWCRTLKSRFTLADIRFSGSNEGEPVFIRLVG